MNESSNDFDNLNLEDLSFKSQEYNDWLCFLPNSQQASYEAMTQSSDIQTSNNLEYFENLPTYTESDWFGSVDHNRPQQLEVHHSHHQQQQQQPVNEPQDPAKVERKKAKKGRRRLDESEKLTRRKASNRKAAEKYRNKKKEETGSICKTYEMAFEVINDLLHASRVHSESCKDEKLKSAIRKAEVFLASSSLFSSS